MGLDSPIRVSGSGKANFDLGKGIIEKANFNCVLKNKSESRLAGVVVTFYSEIILLPGYLLNGFLVKHQVCK